MKRTLLLINLLLLSVCVFPQENIEVNYATIKKYVENQSDDYQQLIERFEANDSLLSLNDYALIYYGHSFTPKYKGSMELWKELETLMEEKKLEEYRDTITLLKKGYSIRNIAKLQGIGISTVQRIKNQFIRT